MKRVLWKLFNKTGNINYYLLLSHIPKKMTLGHTCLLRWYDPSKKYSLFDFLLVCWILKERGLAYPTFLHLGSGNDLAYRTWDDKSTYRYVNRRTPPCMLFEFSGFRCTRQKRAASISTCKLLPAFALAVWWLYANHGAKVHNFSDNQRFPI